MHPFGVGWAGVSCRRHRRDGAGVLPVRTKGPGHRLVEKPAPRWRRFQPLRPAHARGEPGDNFFVTSFRSAPGVGRAGVSLTRIATYHIMQRQGRHMPTW